MTSQIPPAEAARLLYRDNLMSYVIRAFRELRGDVPLDVALYMRAICHLLERIERGEVKRAMILMPPRHLKSTIANVAFTAWLMGRHPGARIMSLSYGSDLAEGFSRDVRRLIEAPWHRAVFPGLLLDPRRASASELRTTAGGYRMARSMGGAITGFGGDFAIIDDPMKAEDAQSETQRDAVYKRYSETTVSRLDKPIHGAILLIMQRLHEDDLAGRLLPSGDWEILELPAIETRVREVPLPGGATWTRCPDDILAPTHMDRGTLDRVRREVGSKTFEAQYQQSPTPAGGSIIRPEWFGTIPANLRRKDYEAIVQSWDTASVPGESNDYSVCTTWGLKGNYIDLLDVHRGQHIYPELRQMAFKLRQTWAPHLIVVETQDVGRSLCDDLMRQNHRGVRGFSPRHDKVQRMSAQTVKLERKEGRLPHDALWKEGFLSEVASFPNGKYDDQVDTMSQLLYALDRQPAELRHCSRFKG